MGDQLAKSGAIWEWIFKGYLVAFPVIIGFFVRHELQQDARLKTLELFSNEGKRWTKQMARTQTLEIREWVREEIRLFEIHDGELHKEMTMKLDDIQLKLQELKIEQARNDR